MRYMVIVKASEDTELGVLRQFLGEADVAGHPGERADQPGRLHAPHRVDDTGDIEHQLG